MGDTSPWHSSANRKFILFVSTAIAIILFMAISIQLGFVIGVFGALPLLGFTLYYVLNTRKDVSWMTFGARNADKETPLSASRELYDIIPVPLVEISEDGMVLRANNAALKLVGVQSMEGNAFSDTFEGLGRPTRERIADTFKGFSIGKAEMACFSKDGQEVFVQISLSLLEYSGQRSVLAALNDATELKTLEAQFVQSQKMQAVGQLAGGVAHDFNNILTAITGHADLLLQRHDSNHPNYEDLVQIKQNSNRAAALIRQLLAFSRKQTLRPKLLRLDDTLAELSHLLNRLLGEKVALKTEHGLNLRPVRVDERQFEQVIMNLVVNARDAMPEGGTVSIRTRNITLKEEMHRDRATLNPGDYVLIEVRDSGCGIAEDNLSKIFEPFYTTKKVGEGTGLGLSTVYGIIKQTGGFVFADSVVDRGTCFSIYLPANVAGDGKDLVVNDNIRKLDLTGQGRVLLVEDEAPVRSFAARALALRGYSVSEAESGEEALDVLSKNPDGFDIFVSDVIMPGVDGPTWVREALKTHPDTKVIFVSGYAEDAFENDSQEIEDSAFLPKPFSLTDLTTKVKELLDT